MLFERHAASVDPDLLAIGATGADAGRPGAQALVIALVRPPVVGDRTDAMIDVTPASYGVTVASIGGRDPGIASSPSRRIAGRRAGPLPTRPGRSHAAAPRPSGG